MKTGIDYVVSDERRALDLTVARALIPVANATGLIFRQLIERSGYDGDLCTMTQTRVGLRKEEFELVKFRTYIPGTEEPFAPWAVLMRKYGLDELAQIQNILTGDSGVTGHRSVQPHEYEEVMDNVGHKQQRQWNDVLDFERPGWLGQYALYSRTRKPDQPNGPEIRVEKDYEGLMTASLRNDLKLARQLIRAVTGRHIKNHSNIHQ